MASRSAVNSCSAGFSGACGSKMVSVTPKLSNKVSRYSCPKRVNRSPYVTATSPTRSSQTILSNRESCLRVAERPEPISERTSVLRPGLSVFAHPCKRSSCVFRSSFCPCPLTRP